MDIDSFPHQVTRLVFDTDQPYGEFRARYEDAVPERDSERLVSFAKRGASRHDNRRDAAAERPGQKAEER